MNFRILCVLLYLTCLAGCTSRDNDSPAAVTESATNSQSEQQQRQQEAFFTAVKEGDIEAISNYLNNGGDVDVKDSSNRTGLHYVEDIKVARYLIANEADVNGEDSIGNAPFYYWGDLREDLVDEVADTIDVNVQAVNKRTPLFYASSAEAVRKLIERGADVNAEDADGETVFEIMSDNNDILEVLVNTGADTIDVNASIGYKAPLFFATSREVVEKLIERGADILAHDFFGKRSLHDARNSEVVQALIESYSSTPNPPYSVEEYVNWESFYGRTALWSFICSRQEREDDENIEEGVQALINAGADVNAKPRQNERITELSGEIRTPLECAEDAGNEEAARLLRDAGAE